ncbi:Lipoprotein [Candidatus Liberibacter solanacearum]
MDIKKLGLTSTIAVLSATMSLGGCDLFKSPEQLKAEKIANLRSHR